MTSHEKVYVPFDPGFSKYDQGIGIMQLEQFKQISALKVINQKKFQLRMFETNLIAPLKTTACIYYGCVIYGSIIASKYTDFPAEISNNPIPNLPEDQKDSLDLSLETQNVLELYSLLNRDIQYNLKRKSNLPDTLEPCAHLYMEFVRLNNHFKDLLTTLQKLQQRKTR
jgi:hypothetical protein